jgi:hypothetical protein
MWACLWVGRLSMGKLLINMPVLRRGEESISSDPSYPQASCELFATVYPPKDD